MDSLWIFIAIAIAELVLVVGLLWWASRQPPPTPDEWEKDKEKVYADMWWPWI